MLLRLLAMPQVLGALLRLQVMVTKTLKRPGSRCESFLFSSTCMNNFHRIILYAITGCVSALFCLVIISGVRLVLDDPLYLLIADRQFGPSAIPSDTGRVRPTKVVPVTLAKVGQEGSDERCWIRFQWSNLGPATRIRRYVDRKTSKPHTQKRLKFRLWSGRVAWNWGM